MPPYQGNGRKRWVKPRERGREGECCENERGRVKMTGGCVGKEGESKEEGIGGDRPE